MERPMYPLGSKQCLSEMRIILLGSEEGGKTSSGNTIFGREAFALKKSAECVMKDGQVAGRQIIIIDTPGRRRNYLASSTPQLYKDEVVRSVGLCHPGPHALLLIIKITSFFVSQCKQAVEEHLKLFGENVWNHIIVLFTHGDLLEDKTIKQITQEQGEPLQNLLEKCGNRYHVFNNMEKNDNQVIQLLNKIEEMVEQNNGHHFQMDKNVLKGLMEKRKEQEQKANERKRMVLPRPKENLWSTTDLRIVLLGYLFSGKSSAGNTILGTDVFSLKTIPTSVHKQAKVNGRQVTIIDTPGWTKDGLLSDTPRQSKEEIVRSVSLCSPGPHAFLLVVPVDTTFKDDDERSIVDHVGLFGEEVWNHAIVVFTHADWMGDTAIEMYIESEGEALQRLVNKCGNRYHALNNRQVDHGTQARELLEKVEHIMVNKGSHFQMDNSGLDRRKSDNLRKEEECEGTKGKTEIDPTVMSSTSSGYGSLSLKSSKSLEDPPDLQRDGEKSCHVLHIKCNVIN